MRFCIPKDRRVTESKAVEEPPTTPLLTVLSISAELWEFWLTASANMKKAYLFNGLCNREIFFPAIIAEIFNEYRLVVAVSAFLRRLIAKRNR
jgi:hypothetical protein